MIKMNKEPEQTTLENWPHYWNGKHRHKFDCNLIINSGSFPLDDEDCTCGLAKLEKATLRQQSLNELSQLGQEIEGYEKPTPEPSVEEIISHYQEVVFQAKAIYGCHEHHFVKILDHLQALQAEIEELKTNPVILSSEIELRTEMKSLERQNQVLQARIKELEGEK